MNFIFRFLGLEVILERYIKNIDTIGWSRANKQYVGDLGIRVENKLVNFPSNGAVLVYANHPTGLDPFLISSLLGRDDVYFLSDVYHAKKGEGIQNHMIPVYYASWKDLWQRTGLAFWGFIFMRLTSGFSPWSETEKKNKYAIDMAVKQLKRGHVVMVFPSGGGNRSRTLWKKGIGEICLAVYKQKFHFNLYMCTINRFSEIDLLCHFLGGRRYLQKKYVVINGILRSISFLGFLDDAVSITRYLQDDFFCGRMRKE